MPKTVKGVAPGFILLPAREYEFTLEQRVEIRIPIQGKISNFLKEDTLATGVKLVGDDDFSVFNDNIFFLWEIIRVLFATSKYPNLQDNQYMNIVALQRKETELIINGEILNRI